MCSISDPLSILANPRCLSPQAVDALKKSLAPKANAKRNGKWVVVKGVELAGRAHHYSPCEDAGRTHYSPRFYVLTTYYEGAGRSGRALPRRRRPRRLQAARRQGDRRRPGGPTSTTTTSWPYYYYY
eukprot:scaffold57409_cov63-Phaeocystis_antarctica.AAC.6